MDAGFVCAIALIWCLWGLLSEILLAATHIKVLLCLGKPYPADELRSKRCTYFLYDLLSPWLALAAAAASTAATGAVSAGGAATFTVAPSVHSTGPGAVHPHHHWSMVPASSPASSNASCPAPGPLFALPAQHQPAVGINTSNVAEEAPLLHHSSATWSHTPLVTHTAAAGSVAQQLPLMLLQPSLPAVLQPSAAHLAAALLLLVAGHAALHLYYISQWHAPHPSNVIEMSASKDMCSRLQRFRSWEVVWFVVGTSYDVITHVVVSGLLLLSMWPRAVAVHA